MSPLTARRDALRSALRQAWSQRSPREQQLLSLAAVLILLATLWTWALAPAWRTWQEAPKRQARLDAQTQLMLQLQAEAKNLKKASPVSRADAIQWLASSTQELGPGAHIQWQGDRATLSVEAAPAAAMARWLSLAREQVQALPVQAQLQHSPASTQGTSKPTAGPSASAIPPPPEPTSAVHWRGSVVLRLPGTP